MTARFVTPGASRASIPPGSSAGWFITTNTKDHKGHNGSGAGSRPRCVRRAFFVFVVKNLLCPTSATAETARNPGCAGYVGGADDRS